MRAQKLARRSNILTREVDDESFLITRRTIEHLNPPATLVWKALDTPRSRSELYMILRTAYPAVSHQKLNADLSVLLRVLDSKQLIRRVKAS